MIRKGFLGKKSRGSEAEKYKTNLTHLLSLDRLAEMVRRAGDAARKVVGSGAALVKDGRVLLLWLS